MSVLGLATAELREIRFDGTSATDEIKRGQVLCQDATETTDSLQAAVGVQTSKTNCNGPFYVVQQSDDVVSGEMVRVFQITGESAIIKVRVDQTVAAGDIGGIHLGTYNFRKGRLGGPLCVRFLDSVTVSSGTAEVLAEVGLNISMTEVERRTYQADYFNDFYSWGDQNQGINQTGDGSSTGGQNAIESVVGEAALYSDGDDNDEEYFTTNKLFKITNPFWVKGRFKITEGATNAANWIFGLTDDAPASGDLLGDNGAGPQGSGDHAVFFKVDGGTVWQAETSLSSTQNTDTDCGTRVSGTYALFEIVRLTSGGPVYFYIDGTLVHTASSTGLPAGSDAKLAFGIKAGTTAEELVTVDYVEVQNPLY